MISTDDGFEKQGLAKLARAIINLHEHSLD
jgi:hypothetical protein